MRILGFVVALIILASCARPGSPDGGPKDETPPEILGEYPANKTTEFKGNSFSVEFDEYVKLKDINKQFFVSPPLNGKPQFKLVKKELRVIFKEDTLKPNTTYRFFFGNAITDLNEGNVLKNYAYTISTGSYIDSCRVEGLVVDAFHKSPIKECSVWLFDAIEDTVRNPMYVTRADENGKFLLENLRPDSFYIVAVQDANVDRMYTPSVESGGFYPNKVLASADSVFQDTIQLAFFREEKQELGADYKRFSDSTRLIVSTNRPCDSCYLVNTNFQPTVSQYFSTNRNDSMVFYILPGQDSVYFQIADADSLVSDTIVLRNIPSAKKPELKKMTPFVQTVIPNSPCKVEYNLPVDTQQFQARIMNMVDSAQYNTPVNWISEFSFEVKLDTLKEAIVYLDSGNVKSIFGDVLGIDSIGCKQGKVEDFGNLNIKVNHNLSQPILLLLDAKGQIVESRKMTHDLQVFRNMKPGKYQLYLINDENTNGHWTPGDVAEMKLSEPVFIYKETIDVRANWDFELEWNVGE